VKPSQGLVSAICEDTRELHLEATQGLELLAETRYWNQNVDTSVSLKGNFTR
jgi:hypothetical protein